MVPNPTATPVNKAEQRMRPVLQSSGTTVLSTQQSQRSSRGNLNISPAEMRARWARNQCFSCEGQFSPNHVCPNAHLRVMIAADNQEEDVVANYEEGEEMEMPVANVECQTMDLHIYSTAGITRPSTMKIQGLLRKHPIVILIDSGASHNFFSADLVQKMGLTVTPTKELGVKLGDGHTVPCKGLCRAVDISAGELKITADCYPFKLGGVDLILGIAWLETLGEVRVNWQKMTMTFATGGFLRKLQGDPALSTSPVSLKVILNTSDVDICFMLWATSVVESELSKGEAFDGRTKTLTESGVGTFW